MRWIIEETITISLDSRGVTKSLYYQSSWRCFLRIYIWYWLVYGLSTFATFSLLDLDLAVNAYPVHLIRLGSPRVLQRYHVWNWLVQSNYRHDGRRRQDRSHPAWTDFIQLWYVTNVAVELLFELVSTGWKRLSYKESDVISYDGTSDTNRSVYSYNHTRIYFNFSIRRLIIKFDPSPICMHY